MASPPGLTLWIQELPPQSQGDQGAAGYHDVQGDDTGFGATPAVHSSSSLRPTAVHEVHDPRTLMYLLDDYPTSMNPLLALTTEQHPTTAPQEHVSRIVLQQHLEQQARRIAAAESHAEAQLMATRHAMRIVDEEQQELQYNQSTRATLLDDVVLDTVRRRLEEESAWLESLIDEEDALLDLMGARILALRHGNHDPYHALRLAASLVPPKAASDRAPPSPRPRRTSTVIHAYPGAAQFVVELDDDDDEGDDEQQPTQDDEATWAQLGLARAPRALRESILAAREEAELDFLGRELLSKRSGAPLWIIDAGDAPPPLRPASSRAARAAGGGAVGLAKSSAMDEDEDEEGDEVILIQPTVELFDSGDRATPSPSSLPSPPLPPGLAAPVSPRDAATAAVAADAAAAAAEPWSRAGVRSGDLPAFGFLPLMFPADRAEYLAALRGGPRAAAADGGGAAYAQPRVSEAAGSRGGGAAADAASRAEAVAARGAAAAAASPAVRSHAASEASAAPAASVAPAAPAAAGSTTTTGGASAAASRNAARQPTVVSEEEELRLEEQAGRGGGSGEGAAASASASRGAGGGGTTTTPTGAGGERPAKTVKVEDRRRR